MKKRLDWYGVLILVVLFIGFYFVTSTILDMVKWDSEVEPEDDAITEVDPDYDDEVLIVSNLYQKVRILYDVVNSKFKVDQEDTIVINDIVYKRITNFGEAVSGIFTVDGLEKYISDLGNYFAYTDGKYYLAGNLVSYQTYYFRGDTTNVYVMDANDDEINAIIYERWTSNNKNTLATIRVVKEDNKWLIDNISILSSDK